jgi:hypothetical protein
VVVEPEQNGDNLNDVKCEISRTSKNKQLEYLKAKLMSFKHTVKTKI